MKALLITVLAAAFSFSAYAQQAMPSTPDISIAGSATSEVAFQGKTSYIYLKNDCASDVYFNFGGKDHGSTHPLRLKSGEVFEQAIIARGMGVSSSTSATACTFTLMLFR